ncbi:Transcriptional modulator WTM2 [Nakaseomyces bracarensis]|uniref:Transcriptional modulator WTM2 n=1 Tax=Nakaseomyces bracarensis TaxID=273131 RepID=UPI003871E189
MLTNRKPIYQHISKFTPRFVSKLNHASDLERTLTWRPDIVPDKESNNFSTTLLYSQGSDIYEFEAEFPLDILPYPIDDEEEEEAADKNDEAQYGVKQSSDVANSPKWVYQGETVSKMTYMDDLNDSALIAMSKNGSMAWFKDDCKVPVHIVQEMMGPSTSFASMHSGQKSAELAISDFSLSMDNETIVKSQSNGYEEESILKIIDNSGKPGDVLRTTRVPGTVITHTVRFFDNHLYASCSDDNIIRFWDTRTGDKPLWILSEPMIGKLTTFDASPVTEHLFATGFSTGLIKLWDARATYEATIDLSYRQNGEDPIQVETAKVFHSGGDSVVDLKFSETASSEFVTVGGSGNVYHWNMEYVFSRNDDDNEDYMPSLEPEDLQSHCLKFCQPSSVRSGVRNSVALHPLVYDLSATISNNNSITLYKPLDVSSFEKKD